MNKNLKYIVAGLAGLGITHQAAAQLYIGDTFYTTTQSLVHVNGDVVYKSTAPQTVTHQGLLEVVGNWNNESTDPKVFTDGSAGTVVMMGGLQTFNGVNTRFPNLTLAGTAKKLQNSPIEIAKILDLTNKELDVNGHTATVLSNEVNAIAHNGGYVNTSASAEGYLVRTVDKINTYEYPLGNTANGNYRYRPLFVKAENAGSIGGQFQNYKANRDYYNTEDTKDGVKGVNENFYHGLFANGVENKVEIVVPFNSADDGAFENITRWDGAERKWNLVKTANASISTLPTTTAKLSSAEKLTLNNSVVQPIALASQYALDLIIPNVFTPNGDQSNDDFVIKGLTENYPNNELVIINRWGNEVFKATNYQNNWNGSELNEGVYFYILKVHPKEGGTKSYTGYVHLMR